MSKDPRVIAITKEQKAMIESIVQSQLLSHENEKYSLKVDGDNIRLLGRYVVGDQNDGSAYSAPIKCYDGITINLKERAIAYSSAIISKLLDKLSNGYAGDLSLIHLNGCSNDIALERVIWLLNVGLRSNKSTSDIEKSRCLNQMPKFKVIRDLGTGGIHLEDSTFEEFVLN